MREYIRSLDKAQFLIILMKDSQLEVCQRWVESCKLRRAYLDATGDILRKLSLNSPQLLHHVLWVPVYVANEKSSVLFNLAEMITESQTTLPPIESFLDFVQRLIESRVATTPLFHEIVTDKSFANIDAISKAFNSMSMTEDIRKCWIIASEPDKKLQETFCCASCRPSSDWSYLQLLLPTLV